MAPEHPARMETHGGVEGGRSHGRDFLDVVMRMTDGDRADDGGALGSDRERVDPSDPESFSREADERQQRLVRGIR